MAAACWPARHPTPRQRQWNMLRQWQGPSSAQAQNWGTEGTWSVLLNWELLSRLAGCVLRRVDACPRAGKKERTFFFDFTASTAVVDKHVRCLSFFLNPGCCYFWVRFSDFTFFFTADAASFFHFYFFPRFFLAVSTRDVGSFFS